MVCFEGFRAKLLRFQQVHCQELSSSVRKTGIGVVRSHGRKARM